MSIKKKTPSTYRIEESNEEFARASDWMKKLFLKKLNFPDKMFSDSKLLDFGTGTGENFLHYLLNGANGTFVEMNKIASHLNYIKSQTKINYNFMNQEIPKIIKNDFNSSYIFSPFISSLNKLMEETKDLLVALEKNDLNEIKSIIKNSSILFKGTVGIGMNYYIGYKD